MLEHFLLAFLIVIVALIGWIMLTRDAREAREHMEAMMHGQEHIAELVAEVLRRPRP